MALTVSQLAALAGVSVRTLHHYDEIGLLRRTARYTAADWQQIKTEAVDTFARLAALMTAGTPPHSPEAMDAAEAHRQHIERWFYPCPHSLHRGLGRLYVDDPRFTANIDKTRPGLAAYAAAAFAANADRAESPP